MDDFGVPIPGTPPRSPTPPHPASPTPQPPRQRVSLSPAPFAAYQPERATEKHTDRKKEVEMRRLQQDRNRRPDDMQSGEKEEENAGCCRCVVMWFQASWISFFLDVSKEQRVHSRSSSHLGSNHLPIIHFLCIRAALSPVFLSIHPSFCLHLTATILLSLGLLMSFASTHKIPLAYWQNTSIFTRSFNYPFYIVTSIFLQFSCIHSTDDKLPRSYLGRGI